MSMNDLAIIVTTIGVISAVVFNYTTYLRATKATDENQGERNGALSADIKYIMRRTDDIYIDQRELKKDTAGSIEKINERLTRTEESIKVAHIRIDDAHKKIDEVVTKDIK